MTRLKDRTYVCNVDWISSVVISVTVRTTIYRAFVKRHHILYKHQSHILWLSIYQHDATIMLQKRKVT